MRSVRRKNAFEHAQNPPIQTIMRVRKSNTPAFCFPFIHSVVSNELLADSETPDETARMHWPI